MTCCKAENFPIGTTVAMLDSNQGIGYQGNLPWPHIKEDVDHFMSICTETSDPRKKNGIILGRTTWEELLRKRDLKLHPKLSYVITSTTKPIHTELLRAVKPSFNEAIEELCKGVQEGDLEKIFVLGGSRNYALAIEDSRLKTIHITRVFNDFPVDQYFPRFDHNFYKASVSSLKEDNGIRFQFEVWERKTS